MPASQTQRRASPHAHQATPVSSAWLDTKSWPSWASQLTLRAWIALAAGVLCGVCNKTDDFAKQGRSCVKCWPRWANVAAVGAMLIVACLALIRIAAFHEFKRASSMKIVVRIAINYISILASLGTFRAKVGGCTRLTIADSSTTTSHHHLTTSCCCLYRARRRFGGSLAGPRPWGCRRPPSTQWPA